MPDPVRRLIKKRFDKAVNTPLVAPGRAQMKTELKRHGGEKGLRQHLKERFSSEREHKAEAIRQVKIRRKATAAAKKAGRKTGTIAHGKLSAKELAHRAQSDTAMTPIGRHAKEGVSLAARKTLAATQPAGVKRIKVV